MKTIFDIEGMTCVGCARTVESQLNSLGCLEISVNNALGEASAILPKEIKASGVAEKLTKIGYPSKVRINTFEKNQKTKWSKLEIFLFICTLFTLPLLTHMLFPTNSLINSPIIQLILCTPVFLIGIVQFGRSAWHSVKNKTSNMDVLIFMGSASAFIYSLYGTISFYGTSLAHHYLFYETSAGIITLVLLGNYLEERAVKKTTSALKSLQQLQVDKATLVLMNEQTKEIETLLIKPGDILLIKEGEKIPTDGIIIEGSGTIDESLLTGESEPIEKTKNDLAIAGAILVKGLLKIRAQATIQNNTISKIHSLIKDAQLKQPQIQRIGDRVSAIFVPVVISIALFTFIAGWQYADLSFQKALISSIAVLVISCPCAMGLATPTAIMVGVGKAAKNGALIKGGDTLEKIAVAKTVIFDKTGTLTNGSFIINKMVVHQETKDKAQSIIKSLEINSSHPIARSLVDQWDNAVITGLNNVKETKGVGMEGFDKNNDQWSFGSAHHLHSKSKADLVLLKNEKLVAELWLEDELKPNAKELVSWLNENNYKVILLSGDKNSKCQTIANQLGIENYFGEKMPDEKLAFIKEINQKEQVIMIGDGINDAPSLTLANVGISFGNATDISQNAADVVILESNDLQKIKDLIEVGKLTLTTIKQNLFWALFYNVVAIPIAALGFLSPIIAAGSMAFSDLIVIGNSIRLKYK